MDKGNLNCKGRKKITIQNIGKMLINKLHFVLLFSTIARIAVWIKFLRVREGSI